MSPPDEEFANTIARAVSRQFAEIFSGIANQPAAEAPKARPPHPERPLPSRVDDEVAARFWQKVEIGAAESCWPWKAMRSGYGYGVFNFAGRRVLAHRFAYTLAKGEIPRGKSQLHSCDAR